MPNPNHECATVESDLRVAMEQAAEDLAASLNGGELSEDAAHHAHAAVEFAIQALCSTPGHSPAPMTQHEAMEASVAAFSREERDQAVSRAHHCVDSALEELRQVAMGEPLRPERAFLLVVALESAGDHLEDILEGLFD
jgi:HEPN domain-containing protein